MLIKRPNKRTLRRITSESTTPKESPFGLRPAKPLGVTTEITAVPRGPSFLKRGADTGARTLDGTGTGLDEEVSIISLIWVQCVN
jgi:hypothetical protein